MKEKVLEISNRFPFSPVPPPTDEQRNVFGMAPDSYKDFMERLERGEHLNIDKVPL